MVEVSFSEGVIVGTRKLLDLPFPRWKKQNNLKSLEFVKGKDDNGEEQDDHVFFQLHPTYYDDDLRGGNRGSSIKFVHIETVRQLDREKQSRYSLDLRARVTTTTEFRSEEVFFRLHVIVLDINDNPPVFDQEEHHLSVNKSSIIQAESLLPLVTLHATDKDTGLNGKIAYSLQQEMDPYFHIDENNGELSAKRSLACSSTSAATDTTTPTSKNNCLDCIKAQLCPLLIYAKDQGLPQQSAYTVVKVHILDSNDHDPVISLRYFPDQSQAYSLLDPNQLSANSSVAAITVTDQDSGIYGQTDLKIISGNSKSLFYLNSFGNNLYVVKVAPPSQQQQQQHPTPQLLQQQEEEDGFKLILEASDRGPMARSTQAELTIKLQKSSSSSSFHKPEFTRDVYSAELSEDTPIGSSVFTLLAINENDSTDIEYGIDDDDNIFQDYFHLDRRSGVVTTATYLDRESKELFKATAYTTGFNRAKCDLEVKVLDVNDEVPTFTRKSDEITISEGIEVGSTIYTAKAYDRDEKFNSITYHLRFEDKSVDGDFAIDPSSGMVIVRRKLDREKKDSYKLIIIAMDNGSPSLLGSLRLQISLSDVNDNAPFFYPSTAFLNVPSVNRIVSSHTLYLAHAYDRDDEASSNNLTYAWSPNTEELVPDFLNLNESTGELTYSYTPRLQLPKVLEIDAKDSGGKISSNSIKLYFSNKDDFKNDFGREFHFQVMENRIVRNVGSIPQYKDDPSCNYEIVDGDRESVFGIDATNGRLFTEEGLDREKKDFFQLSIGQFCDDELKLLNKADIQVLDVNDNPPRFSDEDLEVILINREDPLNAFIHQVRAEDPDYGPNGHLTYEIEQEDPYYGFMAIDRETGTLKKSGPLPDLLESHWTLTVKVSDRGLPEPLSAAKTYTVNVVSTINRHTPTFDFTYTELSLSEATPPGQKILSLVALDKDEGLNGQVAYSVTGLMAEMFGMFPNGDLYLKGHLDREAVGYYPIEVVATDSGSPLPRSSTAKVLILVQDENDNAPKFASRFQNGNTVFTVMENNEDASMILGRVEAEDPDLGRNGQLTYGLVGSPSSYNHYVDVNAATGVLHTKVRLDREQIVRETGRDFVDLVLYVSDHGVVPKRAEMTVSVVILDDNDNAPYFATSQVSAVLSESASVGTQVAQVQALDDDKGINARISYDIINDDDDPFLTIDPWTGQIHLRRELDFETAQSLKVEIMATDGGTPSLNASIPFYLDVLDENDNAPSFQPSGSGSLSLSVYEDLPIGSVLHTFQATDQDWGDRGRIGYHLLDGAGASGANARNHFHLNSQTGKLTCHGTHNPLPVLPAGQAQKSRKKSHTSVKKPMQTINE